MAAAITAKLGAGHCWVLALTIASPQALFRGGGDCTSRSYGIDRPIWDILHVPGVYFTGLHRVYLDSARLCQTQARVWQESGIVWQESGKTLARL